MAKDDAGDIVTEERVHEPRLLMSMLGSPLARSQFFGRLTRARAPATVEIDQATPKASSSPRARPSAYLVSFIVFVLAPAFVASLYFGMLASDQFVAETRFAVTSAQIESFVDKLKAAVSSGSLTPSASGQDAYIIAAYIRSRAIIDDLSKTIDLRQIYRRPEADFWARLKADASAEEMTSYWRDMVNVSVDAPSGIVTVKVRAFRSEDALAVSKAIIKVSEALANEVSARSRADTMKLAENEVKHAEDRVVATLADLRAFRDRAGFIDPASQASSTGLLLTDLLGQKIRLQNEYFVSSRAMSEQAPTVQSLKTRIEGLDQQIAEQKGKLTGASAGGNSIAGLLPKYEELELQNDFAEKLYSFSQGGLERARQRAEAQSIYVSVFVPPALPEEAKFPERFGMSMVISMSLLVLWGIGAMFGAVVEDHRI